MNVVFPFVPWSPQILPVALPPSPPATVVPAFETLEACTPARRCISCASDALLLISKVVHRELEQQLLVLVWLQQLREEQTRLPPEVVRAWLLLLQVPGFQSAVVGCLEKIA